jgi:hypothetical protein
MTYDNHDGPIYSNIQSKLTCNGEQISCYYDIIQGGGGSLYWGGGGSNCPNGCGCAPSYTLPDPYSVAYGNTQPKETWTGDTGPDGRPRVYGNCGNG